MVQYSIFNKNRSKKAFPGKSIFNCRIKPCSLTFAAKFRPEHVEGRTSLLNTF